jgi:phosphoglycolate phosphatase
MTIRAVITDLDNTLYDWVTFFALSFDAMLSELARILNVEREELLPEFRRIHQKYGSTETPWAALELPAARARFPHTSASELAHHLDPAFRAFSAARKIHLQLYDSVADTLQKLQESGTVIIGHTEALPANAFYRLVLLEVVEHFSRLYTIERETIDNPFPERIRTFPPPELIKKLPVSERKPNPLVLIDICKSEGLSPSECLYVGDSLIKDVAMAKHAGITAVWARYGTQYDPRLWQQIVMITHWSSDDVEQETKLRDASRGLQPDFTIDRFDELLALCQVPKATTSSIS